MRIGKPQFKSRGVTLIELLVVITLIGMAYALLPKMAFGGVSGPELKANVRALATGLRLTRDVAINTRREAMLTINLDAHEFSVQNDSRVHKLNEKIDIKLYTSQADLISDKIGSVRFFPDGSSNGGRVTVGAGGRDFALDIDWLTGRISVAELLQNARG